MHNKRGKHSFTSKSKNLLFALLVVAAAVTVYGIAQAAVVSHTPEQIQPQGPASGFDADRLWGLTASEIMAAAGGGGTLTTWGYAQSGAWDGDGNWVVSTPLPGTGAPACPSGWTESYKGYGPYWNYLVSYNPSDWSVKSRDLLQVSEVCGTNTVQPAGGEGSGYSFVWTDAKACLSGGTSYQSIRCNTCRVCVK